MKKRGEKEVRKKKKTKAIFWEKGLCAMFLRKHREKEKERRKNIVRSSRLFGSEGDVLCGDR